MGTRILEGVKINESDSPGAVFYDSTSGRAFGPVFEGAEEAENFLTFLGGVDPSRLTWGTDLSSGEDLYKIWLECGKLAKRPVVQLDPSFINWDEDCESTTHDPWYMICSLTEVCFPLFLGVQNGNNGVRDLLRKQGLVTSTMSTSSERSCFYAYFKTKEDGLAFLDRLNKWLRDNWHKAYPEA